MERELNPQELQVAVVDIQDLVPYTLVVAAAVMDMEMLILPQKVLLDLIVDLLVVLHMDQMVLLHLVQVEIMEGRVRLATTTALEAAVVLVVLDLMELPVLVVMAE